MFDADGNALGRFESAGEDRLTTFNEATGSVFQLLHNGLHLWHFDGMHYREPDFEGTPHLRGSNPVGGFLHESGSNRYFRASGEPVVHAPVLSQLETNGVCLPNNNDPDQPVTMLPMEEVFPGLSFPVAVPLTIAPLQ